MDRLEAMSILVAVVDAGSLSAASRQLAIPLATVSRKVGELEAHLKTRLLQRTTRQLSLTEAGESYVASCRRLLEEIEEVVLKETAFSAFLIVKQVYFLGRKLTFGGFSFGAVLLVRKGKAQFEKIIEEPAGTMDMEVHERVIVDGEVGKLKTPLIHDDYKDLGAWIDRHNKYSTWEARVRKQFFDTGRYGQESIQPRLFGNTQERRRFLKKMLVRMPFEPFIWFFYNYVIKLGFLEGRPGWTLCRMRAQHVFQIRAKLHELNKASRRSPATRVQ